MQKDDWVLLLVFILLGSMLLIAWASAARADAWDEISTDTVWCERDACYDTIPWVLVEEVEGRAVGTEFRTQTGCLLAAAFASEAEGTIRCIFSKESAEKNFPALVMIDTLKAG